MKKKKAVAALILATTVVWNSGCKQTLNTKETGVAVPAETTSAVETPTSFAATSVAVEPEVTIWRPGPATSPPQPLEFISLPGLLPQGEVQLSNGVTPLRPSDWGALAISSTNEGSCTSTLIGPRVMVTAAHCVDAGLAPGAPGNQTLPGSVKFGNQSFQMDCEMHPSYAQSPLNPFGGTRASQDYALCFLNREVNIPGLKFESISTNTPFQEQTAILMTGYGCTNIAVAANGQLTFVRSDKKLRMGDERIERINMSVTRLPGIYARTKSENGEPILCPGDSGGPVVTGATLANQGASRRVKGVNSAVGWAPRPGQTGHDFYSYLSPLGTDAFRTFLSNWLARHQNPIVCGHNRNPGLGACRG